MSGERKPRFESYVPPQILQALDLYKLENPEAQRKDYDKFLMVARPEVPRSTRQRWVRAYTDGRAHSETPVWHIRYRGDWSLVPEKFSALKDKRYHQARKVWEKAGEIRYGNIHCIHRPNGDGALLSLAAMVLKDFKPNAMPAMSDWLDLDRFKPHKQRPHDALSKIDNEEIAHQRRNRFKEFEILSEETFGVLRSAVPDDCVWLNLWGNHETWVLRYLLDSAIASNREAGLDLAEMYIERYFSKLDELGILWVEADRRNWLPLTKTFWVSHGNRVRRAENATTRAYLNDLKTVSTATGHIHRQEVSWTVLPYGERRFAAASGTLGPVQPSYNRQDFKQHEWGFQLITHPFEDGSKYPPEVDDVRIYQIDGYYVTKWRGQEYSIKAEFEYDELLDITA